ncbi:DgyrCDS1682 [Dimorphilus gyrociliatus]|uniref:Protein VAC14 homolog n=1 Tax=Dimorphilus gyrociliatus TaxID=2664684 RepID=A0A7I8VD73_9ANNE|nr:DgyrCDS1682 [Dimorphilus gyrociliatus]
MPFFQLAADPDGHVRNGSGLLNVLVRDVLTASPNMNLVDLINQLRTRIYNRGQYTRMFIVSWIDELDNVPDIDMIVFLPQLLDGLFQILGDNHQDVKQACKKCLRKLLRNISEGKSKNVDYHVMVNIILLHCQSSDSGIQSMAINWLEEFVKLGGRDAILPVIASTISSLLPCLAYEESNKNEVRDRADKVQASIMKLLTDDDDNPLSADEQSSVAAAADEDNKPDNENEEQVSYDGGPVPNEVELDKSPAIKDDYHFNMTAVVSALTHQMAHESVATRIAALHWIAHLQKRVPQRVLRHLENLFPLLMSALSDPDEGVIYLTIEVLSDISSSSFGRQVPPKFDMDIPEQVLADLQNSHEHNAYFTCFMIKIIQLFKNDVTLLDKKDGKGMIIIRQICIYLGAENIYKCLALIILKLETHNKEKQFAADITEMLAYILLTSSELHKVRTVLRELRDDYAADLFVILYKAFCHNSFAVIALCLLSQMYSHSAYLIRAVSEMNVTVDLLLQLDRLVQLVESPIFAFLRMQLLEARHYPYLVESLYGILMLLPQSVAFQTLQTRLQCIPPQSLFMDGTRKKPGNEDREKALKSINFSELLNIFRTIQKLD